MTAFPKADVLLAVAGVVLLFIPGPSPHSQQQTDGAFEPSANDPVYEPGSGPLILIDESHNNFHTKNGRYQPFSRVLEADGYRVDRQINELTEESLSAAGVLVISNALHEQNARRWVLPTPSAFTSQEIQVIVNFVEAVMYSPRVAWEFDQFTRTTNVSGWSQGAAIERGRGRVVLFSEAASLTSQQMQDGTTAGFRSPEARDNEQLALNIVHWLSFVF
jgi:hypothetical protein